MTVYIGIDPGRTGAIARINSTLCDHVMDCPIDGLGIARELSAYRTAGPFPNTTVILERAQAMPKQGVVSMFNYGVSYGVYLGILQAFGIRYVEIRPQVWKVEFGLIGKSKDASIVAARKLFPALGQEICLKKHHGRAESLLLAEYGRRKGL